MLFVDSTDPAEIEKVFAWGVVSGVTTNPLLLARAGVRDVASRVREILGASHGPVSVAVLGTSADAMVAEAEGLAEIDRERIAVKVPFSEVGLQVTRRLAEREIQVNVTCCMSFNQAYLGALAGGTFVSVLAGRIRDMGYDARAVISETRAQLDREGLGAELLIGSVRQACDVGDALSAGAHVVTVPMRILAAMLHNPKTDETIREFHDAVASMSSDHDT